MKLPLGLNLFDVLIAVLVIVAVLYVLSII